MPSVFDMDWLSELELLEALRRKRRDDDGSEEENLRKLKDARAQAERDSRKKTTPH